MIQNYKVWSLSCILFLWIVGCNKKENAVELTLLGVFVTDTIAYKTLSYKIRAYNNSNNEITLDFKKRREIFGSYYEDPDINASVFLFDSARKGKCELFMSSLYRREIILKKGESINLLFLCSDCDLLNSLKDASEDIKYYNELSKMFYGKNIFWFKNKNNTGIDSFPVRLDSNFYIKFRDAHVDDMQ
jgi:hypothetical protein